VLGFSRVEICHLFIRHYAIIHGFTIVPSCSANMA
jgi:hypothetical protein